MGAYFFALLECEVPKDVNDRRVRELECTCRGESQRLIAKCRQDGVCEVARVKWISATDYSEEIARPTTIDSSHCLLTCEGFHVRFGSGAIGLWHPLRWPRFVRDIEWQQAMLAACRGRAAMVDASDVIVTRDGSPIVTAFYRGATYHEALTAGGEREAQVASISELYEIVDEHGTWESHGYWRMTR